MNKDRWRKIPRSVGLYQFRASGTFFVNIRHGGKLHRESLQTKDLAFAKRRLAKFRERLERTNPKFGKVSLIQWLEEYYLPTLRGSPGTVKAKRQIIERVRRTWVKARLEPMADLRPTDIERWLTEQFSNWSTSYYNSAQALLKNALEKATADHAIMENPALGLRYQKRKQPIRLTPTFEQFQQIVADVRGQTMNRDAMASGDFLEFLGLAGLGQAEAASVKRCDVDLDSERIIVYRHKTDTGFVIPIFPQLRPLLEKLCEHKKPNDRLFKIDAARKALMNACKRLQLPHFTQRSLRRMHITRAIERGVDVKVIAQWQGHKDGGKLILQTYSYVRPEHSTRMAALMTTELPPNVIELKTDQS